MVVKTLPAVETELTSPGVSALCTQEPNLGGLPPLNGEYKLKDPGFFFYEKAAAFATYTSTSICVSVRGLGSPPLLWGVFTWAADWDISWAGSSRCGPPPRWPLLWTAASGRRSLARTRWTAAGVTTVSAGLTLTCCSRESLLHGEKERDNLVSNLQICIFSQYFCLVFALGIN